MILKKPQAPSNKQRGLTKKEERLGWITRGHEQQATSLTSHKLSDSSRIIKENKMQKKKKHRYKPTATLKDYKEAIQILMVDYADVWEKTNTFKEVDKKLKKLGI